MPCGSRLQYANDLLPRGGAGWGFLGSGASSLPLCRFIVQPGLCLGGAFLLPAWVCLFERVMVICQWLNCWSDCWWACWCWLCPSFRAFLVCFVLIRSSLVRDFLGGRPLLPVVGELFTYLYQLTRSTFKETSDLTTVDFGQFLILPFPMILI